MKRRPAKKRRIPQDDEFNSDGIGDEDAPFVVAARTVQRQAEYPLARPSLHVPHQESEQQKKRPLEGAAVAPAVSTRLTGTGDRLPAEDTHGTGRVVAKLVCVTTQHGRERAHLIRLGDADCWIGRHKDARVVIHVKGDSGSHVDVMHARIYALESDTKEVLVCCQDQSVHGTLLNGVHTISRQTVILDDGDELDIGPQAFRLVLMEPSENQDRHQNEGAQILRVKGFTVSARTLGTGAFASVRLATHNATGRQVACKVMKNTMIAKKGFCKQIKHEIAVLADLDHPNLAIFLDTHEDTDHTYIFMELFLGGDLWTYINVQKDGSGLDSTAAKFILFQLLKGLDYLHNQVGVAHRDIKPENIVLRGPEDYPLILITDFGTASNRGNTRLSREYIGTIEYWPPECFTGAYDPRRLDCYSTGAVLFMMLSGRHPYADEDSEKKPTKRHRILQNDPSSADLRAQDVFRSDVQEALTRQERIIAKRILSGSLRVDGPEFDVVDKRAISLVRSLMASDPMIRYSVHDAQRHDWLTTNATELQELYDRKLRKVQWKLDGN